MNKIKKYGADEHHMFITYVQQMRSISEMACPVWKGALTQLEIITPERVQRTAQAVIGGVNQTTYQDALEHFKISSQKDRKEALCLKFAIKACKKPGFSK